ncbi:hypothetical protein NDU88_006858 [Pleurodeles waltl]|uniref:Uncharacterized protein n=1 Tax=Pleurodeles waltl TaxID=8319 RepID=A0AAV7MH01_PLEWA|nr:hypothetical protein NDU88_006858 [Pleurodeles waltl]
MQKSLRRRGLQKEPKKREAGLGIRAKLSRSADGRRGNFGVIPAARAQHQGSEDVTSPGCLDSCRITYRVRLYCE